jgi:rRNA maturation endonuclease Nob1
MIGQITKGSGIQQVVRYLLRPDKGAEILDTTAFSDKPEDIANTFELNCARNPLVQRTVTHVSLSFAAEDGEIDRETKIRIGEKVIHALGHSNGHYLMVAHGRSDPGHRHEHEHDHMHIAMPSVDFEGKWVDDSWNFKKLESVLREIEREENFRQLQSSWEIKRAAPGRGQKQRFERELAEGKDAALPVSDRLQAAVTMAAQESRSVGEMAQRLAHQNIETRLNITRNGEVRGISYQMEGVKFQGSQLYDVSAPKLESVQGLRRIKNDIESIHNIKRGMDYLRSLPLSETRSPVVEVESRKSQELELPVEVEPQKPVDLVEAQDKKPEEVLAASIEEPRKSRGLTMLVNIAEPEKPIGEVEDRSTPAMVNRKEEKQIKADPKPKTRKKGVLGR